MVQIVNEEEIAVGRHVHTVSALELACAPCFDERAVPFEDHHRVVAAVEDVDAVLPVDRHRRGLLEAQRVRYGGPSVDRLIDGCLGR